MAGFLKNLFVAKWQHSDSSIRLSSIDASSDPSILHTLAFDDVEEVRLKAIGFIQDTTELTTLIQDKSSAIKTAATEQYLSLILGASDQAAQLTAIASITDTTKLMSIATLANNEVSQAALAKVNNESALFEFILQSSSAAARKLAIDKIQSTELLKNIEKQFKGKDKTLTRIAKNKLSQNAQLQAEQKAVQDHICSLLSQAQQLASHGFKPTYLAEFTYLKQQWENVEASAEKNTDFTKNIEISAAVLKQNQAEIKAQQEQQANTLASQKSLQLIIVNLQEFTLQAKAGDFVSIDETLKECQQNWLSANQLSKANKTVQNEYEKLLKPLINLQVSLNQLNASENEDNKGIATNYSNLQKQLKECQSSIHKINWPSEFPNTGKLNKLFATLDSITQALDVQKGNEKETLNTLKNALNKFEQLIEEGHLKSAKQQQASIRKLLNNLPKQVDKGLQTSFSISSEKLNELNDWQGFAAAPKLLQLCEDMESLIGQTIDPKELANQIHTQQEQWKALGALPDKKQHNQLWHRFKTAADAAYIPCKEYFNNLQKIKEFNKGQREEICLQLENFYQQNDWPNADWKAIQGLLEQVNNEYKKYGPVDHAVHKTLQKRFSLASKNIHDKLIGFYQTNAEQKQSLVNKVQTLVESELTADTLKDALEACKTLQGQWKDIGPAGRNEHTLWRTFRQSCDALFNKRQEQNQANKQHLTDERLKADALLEEAQELAKGSNQETISQINELKTKLAQLDLSAKAAHHYSHELDALLTQVKNNKQAQAHAAKQALWNNAQMLSGLIADHELNNNEDAQPIEQQSIEQKVSQTTLPSGVLEIFQQRLQNNGNGENTDKQNESYRELCLRLEICQEQDSPAADQAARMALQVKRLQENMGQTTLAPAMQRQALLLNWFAITANTPQYKEYESRFFALTEQK